MNGADYPSPGTPPMADEAGFVRILDELVAVDPPRLFAVIQEYGGRVDAWLAAWGLAFEDHVDLLDVEQDEGRVRLRSLDQAAASYTEPPHVSTRVIWWDESKRNFP